MSAGPWSQFVLLGLVWGSSFLWIKVALGNGGHPFLGLALPEGTVAFGPFLLVTCRLLFGLLGLAAVAAAQRIAWPRNARTHLAFAFMGVFNTALPFTLITWGETRIDSALASILNGTVPLFTTVIAHLSLEDERLSGSRLLGLVIGFLGVIVLVSRDLGGAGAAGSALGGLAVVAAAVSYGCAAVFSRRHLRGQPPVTQSFMSLVWATACMALATWMFEPPQSLPRLPVLWFAVAWLGLLGSCLAYLLYFSLLNTWGPTRASLVTYTFPVVGLVLGVSLLGEPVDWRLFAGGALVIVGVLVVNASGLVRAWPRVARSRAQTEAQ